jgi:hypothetical protein
VAPTEAVFETDSKALAPRKGFSTDVERWAEVENGVNEKRPKQ